MVAWPPGAFVTHVTAVMLLLVPTLKYLFVATILNFPTELHIFTIKIFLSIIVAKWYFILSRCDHMTVLIFGHPKVYE